MANIEHLLTIKVPAQQVYEALTTRKGLGAVWTTELQVYQDVGAINEFTFGTDTDRMKIIELVPGKKVVWEVVASDPEWVRTIISFELEDKGTKTAITLKHMHWREVTDFFRSCNYNWGFFLYSLKLYCEEGKGMPYQHRKF
ncbi:SRPBCC family protein [Paraflavitalea pollutisoli]|uniref:SRPBCC family protein n=1 Tax=Paraflavitalea pollutisoli TaxID=3034143 RepID=UPI0023EB5C02|nr:SRPBCC domain-containing protein [Paraflavitalea sp. H1-2-19X]